VTGARFRSFACLCLLPPFLALVSGCAGPNDDTNENKPRVIQVFACTDYCPGPEERYLKNVYEGIGDEARCLELGGRPYVYVGWGTHFVCIAD